MFRSKSRISSLTFVALFLACANAHAQFSKVNSGLNTVQVFLIGLAVTIFTIAFVWAGFKMAFQHAKWSEIAHIVYGALLAGAGAGIAAALVG